MRALFARLDTNHDGGVDAVELGTAIEEIAARNPSLSLPTAEEALAALDRNGDGSIGLKELKRAFHAYRHARQTPPRQPVTYSEHQSPVDPAASADQPRPSGLQAVSIQVTASVSVAVAVQRYSAASQSA